MSTIKLNLDTSTIDEYENLLERLRTETIAEGTVLEVTIGKTKYSGKIETENKNLSIDRDPMQYQYSKQFLQNIISGNFSAEEYKEDWMIFSTAEAARFIVAENLVKNKKLMSCKKNKNKLEVVYHFCWEATETWDKKTHGAYWNEYGKLKKLKHCKNDISIPSMKIDLEGIFKELTSWYRDHHNGKESEFLEIKDCKFIKDWKYNNKKIEKIQISYEKENLMSNWHIKFFPAA